MDRFWDVLKDLVCNYLLISAVCAWFAAQIIKFLIGLFNNNKKSLKDFVFSMGGMPSSHSATMMGLTTAAALKDGFGSSVFAVCAIFSIIVMRDAFGVRYQTGKQAKLLNSLMKKENQSSADSAQNGADSEKLSKEQTFDESVGHTPMQVVIGALVGVAVGVALAFVFVY